MARVIVILLTGIAWNSCAIWKKLDLTHCFLFVRK